MMPNNSLKIFRSGYETEMNKHQITKIIYIQDIITVKVEEKQITFKESH